MSAATEGLVLATRDIAKRAADSQAVTNARAAASALTGMVVTSDEDAAEVADQVKTIQLGRKALRLGVEEALQLPKQATAAVKAVADPILTALDAAEFHGKGAVQGFLNEKARAARAEEDRRRREAAEQARRAAEEAQVTGEHAPPPVEVAPIEAPRQVKGGAGAMHQQVRCSAVEITDHHECDPTWLRLDARAALDSFATACARGDVQKPKAGESVVWRGVRFEGVVSMVSR